MKNSKKLTKEEKIIRIVKRMKRGEYLWWKSRRGVNEDDIFSLAYQIHITLTDILLYVKRKFRLKDFAQQLQIVTAAWKWSRDDLRRQPSYCIDIVYYLVFVRLPRPKKEDKQSEAKEGDGLEERNEKVHD